MPRKARIDASGALHHIIVRGIERRRIFSDDQDRDNFVERLGDIVTETQTCCFAWALIPNHAHILIHLNPLCAKIVKTLTDTDKYPYSGHGALMGKIKRDFQDTDYVLRLFGKKVPAARKAYRGYVEKGIAQGRRPELVGGGLIRSAVGWSVIKTMRQVQDHMKSDERILGDGDFTQSVLDEAKERLEERCRGQAQGYDSIHKPPAQPVRIEKGSTDTERIQTIDLNLNDAGGL